MDATPEKPEGAGYDEERRQAGFLPDFRETIKAARGPREGDRAKRAVKGKAESGVILFESRSAYVAHQTAASSTSVNALTRGDSAVGARTPAQGSASINPPINKSVWTIGTLTFR